MLKRRIFQVIKLQVLLACLLLLSILSVFEPNEVRANSSKQTFEALGGEVHSIQFSSEAPKGISFNSKTYFTNDLEKLYYKLHFHFAKEGSQREYLDLSLILHYPNGQVMENGLAHRVQVNSDSKDIHVQGHLELANATPAGEYLVQFLLDDQVIGQQSFLLTATVNQLGNTSGNLHNKGLAATQGDYIFYANQAGLLYRSRMNGQEVKRLTNDAVSYINVQSPYVYYVNESKGNIINRLDINGTNPEQVISHDHATNILVAGEWIYYINHSDAQRIYRISTSGEGKSKITEEAAHEFYIQGNWIYYIQPKELPKNKKDRKKEDEFRGYIYKVRTDGQGTEPVSKLEVQGLVVTENWLYFLSTRNNDQLFRLSLDGSELEGLTESKVVAFYVDEQWLYFQTDLNRGRIIFQRNLHTHAEKEIETHMQRIEMYELERLISRFPVTTMNIAYYWLYYNIDGEDWGNHYRLDTHYSRGGEELKQADNDRSYYRYSTKK